MTRGTEFTRLVGCDAPIQQAPMGSVSTPELAVAVADAGGVGSVTALGLSPARLDTMLAVLERLVPERLEVMRRLARKPDERGAAYAGIERWSFGRDVFARLVESLVAVPVADVGWSDWRTPQAIARSLAERAEKPLWWASAAALVA